MRLRLKRPSSPPTDDETQRLRKKYTPDPAPDEPTPKKRGRPSSLSPKRLKRMFRLLESGKTQMEVASLLGVSQATVSYQLKRKRGGA